jgi:hypothetical protein
VTGAEAAGGVPEVINVAWVSGRVTMLTHRRRHRRRRGGSTAACG